MNGRDGLQPRHWRTRVRTPGGGVTLVDCSPDEDERMERTDTVIWRIIGVGLLIGCTGAGILLVHLVRIAWKLASR